MENITIINATSHGGLDIFASKDGRVIYAGWDLSHWDTNTTGGDAGAIMITGDHLYMYNATFINCTSVGRGGAVFLQDNRNATIELSTFENNYAQGIAKNTWQEYTLEYNSTYNASNENQTNLTLVDYKLTGHGGAVAFDVNAKDCKVLDSEFTNNLARRNGGAINFDEGSTNNTIRNCNFENNTVYDDGGAINFDHGSDLCSVYDCNFTNNTGLGRFGSTTKGGTICLTGSNITISSSKFVLGVAYANTTEGAKLYQTDAGALFITGNYVNVTDCNFTNCSAPNVAGAIKIIGNFTKIIHCIIENCTVGCENNPGNATGIYIQGHDAVITNSRFANLFAPDVAGAIYVEGENATINDTEFYSCNATIGGALYIEGNNATVSISRFYDSFATKLGGAIYVSGNNMSLSGSTFNNSRVSMIDADGAGGALYILGNDSEIDECDFNDSHARYGGCIYVVGQNTDIMNSDFKITRSIL